jgi:hypothetical protein
MPLSRLVRVIRVVFDISAACPLSGPKSSARRMDRAQRNPSPFATANAVIFRQASRIVVCIACPVERIDAKPDHAMEG